jgi:hypothetical protein
MKIFVSAVSGQFKACRDVLRSDLSAVGAVCLLPRVYRRLLLAVGIFDAGAFAHTLLILWAAQRLTPALGASGAASAAVALYVLHNAENF